MKCPQKELSRAFGTGIKIFSGGESFKASLNQAYNTLAGLTEGNRFVGIISHVAELKEKIDKQILVTKKKAGGSNITVLI